MAHGRKPWAVRGRGRRELTSNTTAQQERPDTRSLLFVYHASVAHRAKFHTST